MKLNQDLHHAKCFIDGANVAMFPNQTEPSLKNIKTVIRGLKDYFDIKPISIYVIWKLSLRHYLSESDKKEFSILEQQGLIVQSFLGKGERDDELLLCYADEFQKSGQ